MPVPTCRQVHRLDLGVCDRSGERDPGAPSSGRLGSPESERLKLIAERDPGAPSSGRLGSPESDRLKLIAERDGPDAARAWALRTLAIYRQALASPGSHASLPHYRPLFRAAIRQMEDWLAEDAVRRHATDAA